jgi:hypothetical protein
MNPIHALVNHFITANFNIILPLRLYDIWGSNSDEVFHVGLLGCKHRVDLQTDTDVSGEYNASSFRARISALTMKAYFPLSQQGTTRETKFGTYIWTILDRRQEYRKPWTGVRFQVLTATTRTGTGQFWMLQLRNPPQFQAPPYASCIRPLYSTWSGVVLLTSKDQPFCPLLTDIKDRFQTFVTSECR